MKTRSALLFAIIGWFAIIEQYILMLENTPVAMGETTIRFFSYFTILTNLIVALYFTAIAFSKNERSSIHKPGTLTAVTIYISMVCIIYQLALRGIVELHGMRRLVDELLHSLIPVLTIIFWCLYERTKAIRYQQVFSWAIYPLIYLVFILFRGKPSGFYPYYFVDVSKLGMEKVLINSGGLVVAFFLLSVLFIFIGKTLIKR